MTSAVSSEPRDADSAPASPRRLPAPSGHALGYAVVLVAAALLDLWALSRNGYDSYYGASAWSGAHSWKAFFFGSLDSQSYITIDKPPLTYWLQGLTARVIGFGALSVLLPQALCGVASVAVLHRTVRLTWGRTAALIAAAVFALTPVTVATARSNHPDMTLTLMITLAAWGLVAALRTGRAAPLLGAGAALGLGFMAKMSAALLPVPVLAATYLALAPVDLRKRIGRLAAAAGVMVVIGGAWVAIVALTPAADRPYLGGSPHNGIIDIVWNYNGPGRLLGSAKAEDVLPPGTPAKVLGATPGLERLFAPDVAGQIAWLFPLAVVGLVAGLAATRRAARTDLARAGFVLWGGWAVLHFAAYSFDKSQWHAYYTVAIAPALAALAGGGIVTMVRRRDQWPVLAVALGVTLGWEAFLLHRTPHYLAWLALLTALAGAATYALLSAAAWRTGAATSLAVGATVLGVGAALAGPLAYDLTTVREGSPKGLLQAGPLQKPVLAPVVYQSLPQILDKSQGFDPRMIAMLKQQRGHARWLIAVPDGPTAGAFILATHEPVMAMGGFRGTDPAMSPERLQRLVGRGDLRFILLTPPLGGVAPPKAITDRDAWIKSHCTGMGGGQGSEMYDCASPSRRP